MHRCYAYRRYVCILYWYSSIIIAAKRQPLTLDYNLKVYTLMASKCISKLNRLRPPNSLDRGLQVYLQSYWITPSKCISKLTRLRPSNSLDHGLYIPTIMGSKYISSNLLDHGLQVYRQTCWTMASKLAQSPPPSVSPNKLNYRLQVHLQTCSITASECISKFTWLQFSDAPRIALKHRLQPVQIYRV